jgi:hypothetical protein
MLMHPHRLIAGAHGGKFRLAHGVEGLCAAGRMAA